MSPNLYRYLSRENIRIVEDSRTTRDFKFEGDIWPIVEDWAKMTRFKLKESSKTRKLYVKSWGIAIDSMMLEIKKTEEKIRLEAWVKVTPIWWSPMEVPIESKYSVNYGWVPQTKKTRRLVNKLLEKFGQPEIL